ncbi:hypothetical protein ETD86_39325 [Nonomuraea turkmeniaca]|uniref:Uncharacterized protein n=1 Tax=Nonomuraea turkmeniaca TaxID=103838 RepID=A0A5S4F320_9ACTN|nr:hypothetical protein [Nonomuraea turkmeniaca]TMR10504.1 hypothetical protein ETD86_39325 [Nonomuraea turkmeniaca]
MPVRIVNPQAGHGRVDLDDPFPYGYLLLSGHVSPRPPVLPMGRAKRNLFLRLHGCAEQLRSREDVRHVSLFDALVMPPLGVLPYVRDHRDSVHLARFDVVALVETASPQAAREVRDSAPYAALRQELDKDADDTHELLGRNAKRIAQVGRDRRGVYIFNHFVGDDPEVVLELWEHLAAWYVHHTQASNSLMLVPDAGEKADYVAVNHGHWDTGVLRLLWRQVSSPGFRGFVQANLAANRTGSMPVFYRLIA